MCASYFIGWQVRAGQLHLSTAEPETVVQEDVEAADTEFNGFTQSLQLKSLDARVCPDDSTSRQQLEVVCISSCVMSQYVQGKVKAIADAVWARLSGSFSKDVLHAQHVFVFVQILRAGKASKGACDCTNCSFRPGHVTYWDVQFKAVLRYLRQLFKSRLVSLPC